jgi:hypothetical protein
MSGLIKIRPVVAELFHADGKTDMTKLTVAFRNYANSPEISIFFVRSVKRKQTPSVGRM